MSLVCLLDTTLDKPSPEMLYLRLTLPPAPSDRPYVFINMAATLDGKIVVGEPGGTAAGVGDATDQLLFRRLQQNADAALVGAATLRAGNVIYPPHIRRYVATLSGNLPLQNRFFTDSPELAYALIPENLQADSLPPLQIRAGHDSVDLAAALKQMRQKHGVQKLLCEGGGALNDAIIRQGLADEFFLTLTPKLKGGAHLATVMGGEGFPPGQFCRASLVSVYMDSGELYLRYRI